MPVPCFALSGHESIQAILIISWSPTSALQVSWFCFTIVWIQLLFCGAIQYPKHLSGCGDIHWRSQHVPAQSWISEAIAGSGKDTGVFVGSASRWSRPADSTYYGAVLAGVEPFLAHELTAIP